MSRAESNKHVELHEVGCGGSFNARCCVKVSGLQLFEAFRRSDERGLAKVGFTLGESAHFSTGIDYSDSGGLGICDDIAPVLTEVLSEASSESPVKFDREWIVEMLSSATSDPFNPGVPCDDWCAAALRFFEKMNLLRTELIKDEAGSTTQPQR